MNTIEVNNFVKRYKTKTVEVKDVLFSAQVSLLVGANGSGKSTLLQAIAGLIRFEGTIAIDGRVMYLPERPYFPRHVTVRAFIDAFVEEIDVEPLVDLFELREKEADNLNTLSKGMQAKVQLIQCFCRDAEWYVLDEPLSGLDHSSIEVLLGWLKERDKQCIIATHQLDQWQGLDAEVICLD